MGAIAVIVGVVLVGAAVVGFLSTDFGDRACSGCMLLLMLFVIGLVTLLFLGLFGFGCAAIFH